MFGDKGSHSSENITKEHFFFETQLVNLQLCDWVDPLLLEQGCILVNWDLLCLVVRCQAPVRWKEWNQVLTSWPTEHCNPTKGSSVCRRLSLLSEKASSLAVSQVTPTATGWCKISHAEVRVTLITLSLRTTSVLVAPCSDFKVLLLSLLCRALTSS